MSNLSKMKRVTNTRKIARVLVVVFAICQLLLLAGTSATQATAKALPANHAAKVQPKTASAQQLCGIKQPDNHGYFGSSVSITPDGTRLAIGAEGANAGAAYTFDRSGSTCTLTKEVTDPVSASLSFFSGPVMSQDGQSYVVGVVGDYANTAYVFNATDGSYSKLVDPDINNGPFQYGDSVTMSGDGNTVLVTGATNNGNSTNFIYTFVKNNGSWTFTTKIAPPTGTNVGTYTGQMALSYDGQTAFIGSIDDNSQEGAVYVFARNGGSWSQTTKIVPQDGMQKEYFGSAIALSYDGSTLAIGGTGYSTTTNANEGATYVYTISGGSWSLQAEFVASDASGGAYFGDALALNNDGSVLIVGAGGAFSQDPTQQVYQAGTTYVFTRNGSSYTEQGQITPPGAVTGEDFGGSGIALSKDGSEVAIGAKGVGFVFVYSLNAGGGTTNGSHAYSLPLLANNATTAVGNTTTYITFQNLSSTAVANITIQYFDLNTGTTNIQKSRQLGTDSFQLVAKGQKAILPNIAQGSSASGVITSDQPLNVVVSEALNNGGSAYNVAGSTAATLYSPLALNGQYGFNTNIVIFNAATSGSESGTISFYDENGNLVAGATQNFTIPAHASQTFNQAASGSGLNASHAYWAKITGNDTSATLSAQVVEFGPNNFVATFNALVPSQLQKTLYAPATFNGQFNFVTGMAIANPNGAAASASITYFDANGTSLLTQPLSVPANGVVGVYQPGVNGLSSTVSSASITSNQPLIMTVNERGAGTISGTYVGIANGNTSVQLPVMANGFAGFVTGATVLNTNTSANANITLTYLDANGNPVGTAQSKSLAPNASFLVYQGDSGQSLPAGFFGTAVITSDQPVLVTTNALNTSSGLFYTYNEPSN